METEVNITVDGKDGNDSNFDFGRYLRKLRKEKRLTQLELAELSGLSVMSIRRYESNERHPGLEEMIKLGKILGFVMSVGAEFITEGEFTLDNDWQDDLSALGQAHSQMAQMSDLFTKLNSEGRKKAIEMVTMLTHVPEYTMLSVSEGKPNGND